MDTVAPAERGPVDEHRRWLDGVAKRSAAHQAGQRKTRERRAAEEAARQLYFAHSKRFRRVSNRYPLQVTYAYGGDPVRAAADDDVTVAATVAAWELSQGIEPRDWPAIGRCEKGTASRADVTYFERLFGPDSPTD